MDAFWAHISAPDVHPAMVLLPYALLPAVGFPVSPFLVLLGLRFGAVWGTVLVLAVMPFHLAVSFWFTRMIAGRWIYRLAQKIGDSIPRMPENRQLGYGFLFMIVPGLSYALKNYLLPLSGIRFFPYMMCAWLTQGIMGFPFVIMGKALVHWDIELLAVAACIVLVVFLFKRKILDIYRHVMKRENPREP